MLFSLVSCTLSLNVRSPALTTPARASVSMVGTLEGTFVYGPPVAASKGLTGFSNPTSFTVETGEATTGKVVPTAAAPKAAPAAPATITEAEVLACQAAWAAAIAKISSVYLAEGDYVAAAAEAAGELYGYGHHNVLFKPTKATKHPFRPTGEVAMSYFVGADAMGMDEFKGEDAGFAINGGKGWAKVVFTNHQIALNSETAVAMGSYDFTCATTGDIVTVEYTFGYKRCADGKPRIFLHHSSVPYKA